ncbi:MAG: glycosyltransferase [Myxococcota bacterium]|nr:glycosyltransferase [Myxococcota bacterium]
MSPPGVLHLDTELSWRGGQRQLELLALGLADLGFEQRIACVPGSPISQALAGLPQLAMHPGRDPRNWALLRGAPEPLLAAHTSRTQSLAVWAGRRPVVHRRVDFRVRGRALKTCRALGFIAVSSAVRGVLMDCGVASEDILVVPDGVQTPPAVPPANLGPGRIALAVGALVDHKDHRTLAAAAALLPDVRVLVAGEGPLRPQLEGTALELLGQREDVPALLARADCFVHCSKEEGLGQAVLEAMRAGVPVVATRAGGVPEVVGTHGLLVAPQDPNALAEAIGRSLAGDRPDTRRAAEHAAQWSAAAMVERTAQAYRHFHSRLH